MWQKFKREYNRHVGAEHLKINDGRKYEFFSFALSGQFENFNVADTIPAYISGDIFRNVEDKPLHIQIKGNGGSFKMAYSESYLKNLKTSLYANFIKNVPNYDKTESEFVDEYTKRFEEAKKQNEILANSLKKNGELKQNPKTKQAIIKEYLKAVEGVTSWYVFFAPGSGDIEIASDARMGMSFALHKSQMENFVKKNADLFRVEYSTESGSKQKVIKLVFVADKLSNPLSPKLWNLGLAKRDTTTFLMNGIERDFYALRRNYAKNNKNFIKKYNEYVKPGGVTSDQFIAVYETMFGPLQYK